MRFIRTCQSFCFMGTKINDRVSSLFNAEYTYATGRYKFRYRRTLPDGSTAYDTTAVRQNGDIESLRIEGGFFGTTPNGKWNAKVYYYDSERGIPGPILNNVWRHGERQWDRNFFTQGSWQNDFGRYKLLVNAKYAYDYTEYLRDDPKEIYIHNHYRQQEGYLSAAHLFHLFHGGIFLSRPISNGTTSMPTCATSFILHDTPKWQPLPPPSNGKGYIYKAAC